MDVERPSALLGGLSPRAFVRRHWQRKPLLVRGAWRAPLPGLDRARLLALAAAAGVESRLVERQGRRWRVRHGPLARRSLPSLAIPGWTVLVQGVDLHVDAARMLLDAFRFLGDARLDDVMVSFATDRGGVGPHVDSYDVFLLQLAGRRRWRVGAVDPARARVDDEAPLRVLSHFVADDEWLLEPGDMLYLPPGVGHDGVAVGECLTASIGFRAPREGALAVELAGRLADAAAVDAAADPLFRDAPDAGSGAPARIAPSMQRFAAQALERLLADDAARSRALGEILSEPKATTWFDAGAPLGAGPIALDRRTRMLYDDAHVFVNGESFDVGAGEAPLLRRLADERRLDATSVAAASGAARALLERWAEAGWLATTTTTTTTKEMP